MIKLRYVFSGIQTLHLYNRSQRYHDKNKRHSLRTRGGANRLYKWDVYVVNVYY